MDLWDFFFSNSVNGYRKCIYIYIYTASEIRIVEEFKFRVCFKNNSGE